jgi:hypothetical protein
VTFRNPITSLPADQITSGNLAGTYQLTGSILAGNASGSHIAITPTGQIFYAADGVTPLITLDTSVGNGTIFGTHINGSSISGSTITAGVINGSIITGATVQSAATGTRTVMDSSGLHWYSAVPSESAPGGIDATPDGSKPGNPRVVLSTSKVTGKTPASVSLYGDDPTGAGRIIVVDTDQLMLNGSVVEVGATNGIQSPFFFAQLNGGVLDYLGHPHPRWATGTQRTIDAFSASGTTTAAGLLTINHSLGVVPISIQLTPSGTGVATLQVSAATSTTITVRALNASGAPIASTAIALYYVAIG